MLLIKSSKNTPGTRHRVFIKTTSFLKKKNFWYFYSKTNNGKGVKQSKLLRRRISFFKNQHLKIFNVTTTRIPTTFVNYFCKKPQIKEFGLYKNIYNYCYFSLTTNFSYPGQKFYSLRYIFVNESMRKLIGQIIPVSLIPLNFVISNIRNYINNKNTFAKSLGSLAFRQKILKKTKIILIKLPSLDVKFFPLNTLVCFGYLESYNENKTVAGKWGQTTKFFKKITVRGVAKNPVDHPNGGRTKAKQPEKSPWGWVAKLNK